MSHYDTNYTTGESATVDGLPLDAVLEQAFKNAEYQLIIARKDQTIAQAIKMTDENEILDSDNDLDLLRWYVYPRECASLLKKGEESFPDTLSNKISGGLRPSGFFEAAKYSFSAPLPSVETVEQISNKPESTISNIDDSFDIECEGMIKFRDGEHHEGEAHIDDIIAGHDDGELSDNCLLYVEKEDNWIPVGKFVMRMKALEIKSTNDAMLAKPHQIEPSLQPSSVEGATVTEKDTSREKKKPSRGSDTWGKASVPDVPKPKAFSSSNASDQLPNSKTNKRNQRTNPTTKKGKKTKHIRPPPKLMKYITQAIIQWDMIQEGDRLLLGLSGGKDSLALLHCLLEFQRKLPIKFEIEVCTIDPMTPSFDPSPMIPYVESLGIKYHYIRDNIVERANTSGPNGGVVASLCAFCARMKRGTLYATARKNNCNKLVLAQHLDDCAESFLMSAMHNGTIRSKFICTIPTFSMLAMLHSFLSLSFLYSYES